MASPASHTHSHLLSFLPQQRSTSFVLFRFVLFGSLLFCVSFWICFVRAREGETGGFKRHWKGSLFKKRTRAALLAIMAIMICVLSAAPAPMPTLTSLSL